MSFLIFIVNKFTSSYSCALCLCGMSSPGLPRIVEIYSCSSYFHRPYLPSVPDLFKWRAIFQCKLFACSWKNVNSLYSAPKPTVNSSILTERSMILIILIKMKHRLCLLIFPRCSALWRTLWWRVWCGQRKPRQFSFCLLYTSPSPRD